jgi:hypothetical protein
VPPVVVGHRDRLQVGGIDAGLVMTEVVKGHTCRNRAD